jgi:hypothetical protein
LEAKAFRNESLAKLRSVLCVDIDWSVDEVAYRLCQRAGGLKAGSRDLIPLVGASDMNYWVYVTLPGTRLADKAFLATEANLGVLYGSPSDEQKLLLFRGEWVFEANEGGTEHAQPHWQIHQTGSGKTGLAEALSGQQAFSDLWSAGGSTGLLSRAVALPWSASHKIHFAMQAAFHQEPPLCGPASGGLDQSSLAAYLSGLVRYIREQLLYFSRRA